MTTSFLEFERAGWRDPALCENYDARLSTVTAQCIDALLDAAGVKAGALVLDVATGAVYAAIKAHGSMDVGLPVGPNFFLFSDPERCKASLLRSGFVQPRVVHAAQAWRVPSPETVVETIVRATVRASATLRAQTPEARRAIIAAIKDTIEAYRRGEGYEVPMPAVVAAATKP